MNLKLKRTPGLYLLGFAASGKSTIGRQLADRLGWNFFDTDHEIEAAEKTAIARIVDTRGEAEFRRIENEVLREHVQWIERGRPSVVALGCDAFLARQNQELLAEHGITVWLNCPFEIVERRLASSAHRPPASDPEQLAALYAARLENYRLADVHVAIESDDPRHTVDAILAHPLLK
jgi:shikimate kinase